MHSTIRNAVSECLSPLARHQTSRKGEQAPTAATSQTFCCAALAVGASPLCLISQVRLWQHTGCSEATLQILYSDEQFLAVHKPSGMFVHRSDADRTATEVVVQKVRDLIGSFVYPVHRLDRATSGILLLARSPDAAGRMGRLFSERSISKRYLALVRGHCGDRGRVDTPLRASRGGRIVAEPQSAETHYITTARFAIPLPSGRYATTRCSLVDVRPVTGRYHQIRRHFNYISHPVIGDTSHGDGRRNEFFRREFEVGRLMLAAVRMEFVQPFTQRAVIIESMPDDSFQRVVDRLAPFQVQEV